MSAFDDVGTFHRRFGLAVAGDGRAPALLDQALFDFRSKFLEEELTELRDAHAAGDLAGVVDALVDMRYVVDGTGHYVGVNLDAHHAIVHAANMTKVRAERPEDSKRNHAFDVVKPPGWTAPDHGPLIEAQRRLANLPRSLVEYVDATKRGPQLLAYLVRTIDVPYAEIERRIAQAATFGAIVTLLG